MDGLAKETTYLSIEDALAAGKTVQITPQGTSMYPMFADPHDQAVIAPLNGRLPRRGDVVLYRRDVSAGGLLVLHRVYRHSVSGYELVGDNQSEIERGVREDQLRGILTEWVRCGRRRSVHHIGYRIFFGLWLWMLPLRDPIHRLLARLRRMKN